HQERCAPPGRGGSGRCLSVAEGCREYPECLGQRPDGLLGGGEIVQVAHGYSDWNIHKMTTRARLPVTRMATACLGHSPEAVGPASRQWRRYADAPSATLLNAVSWSRICCEDVSA